MNFRNIHKNLMKNNPGIDSEGKFFSVEEMIDYNKLIRKNYIKRGDISGLFNKNNDIRMKLFNYNNFIIKLEINGLDIRVTEGMFDYVNKRKTYLVYQNKKIIGVFYNFEKIKEILITIKKNADYKI
jgi:hypothetical protein